MISTIAGVESRTWPKNSRHTVRIAGGILCRMKRALVMMPSQPSFWMPGRPARNLSVTSLPRPDLAKRRARESPASRAAAASCRRPRTTRSRTSPAPRRGSCRGCDRCASPRATPRDGVTIRHDARLSSAVPHSTAFLPPAFIATLPPMHDASAEVGSTANTRPAASAASITRRVTTPAPASIVGVGVRMAGQDDRLDRARGARASPC